jgi:DNA-binding MarR family transcriptional regulator
MAPRPLSVAQEIKQTRPFRSITQEAVVALLKTSDDLRRATEALLAPYGITLQQYNVLRILRGAGDDGLPTLEIGERMIEQAPGVTRLLDRLEAKKLVRRERCPEDRRQVTCRISDTGLSLLARLDKVGIAGDDTLLRPLSLADQQALVRLLDRIRAGLRDRR